MNIVFLVYSCSALFSYNFQFLQFVIQVEQGPIFCWPLVDWMITLWNYGMCILHQVRFGNWVPDFQKQLVQNVVPIPWLIRNHFPKLLVKKLQYDQQCDIVIVGILQPFQRSVTWVSGIPLKVTWDKYGTVPFHQMAGFSLQREFLLLSTS